MQGKWELLRFSLLGSGSSGNATLLISQQAKILIDCGFSFVQLQRRVAQVGETLSDLKAVFVTHEHGDHVNGLGVLSRKLGVPVYMTEGTRDALSPRLGAIAPICCFEAGETIVLDDIQVNSFSISHDAADPVSYTVTSAGAKIGFATDLGHPSQLVRSRLAHSHALILEANYCPDMLRKGQYPPKIQQRIRSRMGHLSNQETVSLLSDLLHDELRQVVLFHISENNNCHDLVHRLAAPVVAQHTAQLHLAQQDEPTPLFEVGP